MASLRDDEMEFELDNEFESDHEGNGEEFLGGLVQGIGSMLSGGLGEEEMEDEDELEGEFGGLHESAYESDGEEFSGGLQGEEEWEDEFEGEDEEFLGKAFRGIGRFVKRNAPMLKSIARIAAPVVGTAIGGPLGGMIGKAATTFLREGEYEGLYEDEYEGEAEAVMDRPLTEQQALGELMAAVAARSQTEMEAEAMVGASTLVALSPRDRAALQRVLPALVRGTAVLTRILRRRRATRPVVRAVPTIVRRSAAILRRRAAQGKPVTRRTAARVMATQTRRVLSNPRTCTHAIARNVQASRAVQQRQRSGSSGGGSMGRSRAAGGNSSQQRPRRGGAGRTGSGGQNYAASAYSDIR